MDIDQFLHILRQKLAATQLEKVASLQRLWSGYGEISRYRVKDGKVQSVILKHIQLSHHDTPAHPRGWNTDTSHRRKITSYQIESAWYQLWSRHCNVDCRVPVCYAIEQSHTEIWIALEDLDGAGYPVRKQSVTRQEVDLCLKWLAHFHATFMGKRPTQLWPQGTYWHLATRPDELEALADIPLKQAARAIDRQLEATRFKTFVHGDAKLANFCFSVDGSSAAAVDFQYVGGGCGMKDVAYFVGSCLDASSSQNEEATILNTYFGALKIALERQAIAIDFHALEADWRSLYPCAWTDFHRFLKGWSPRHWKIHSYSEQMAKTVIEQLTTNP